MGQSLGFIQNMRGWEWILILVLALVLFGGAKKLPDAARGLGRSLRIFKAETKGLVGDGDGDESDSAAGDKVDLSSEVGATASTKGEDPGKPSSVDEQRAEPARKAT